MLDFSFEIDQKQLAKALGKLEDMPKEAQKQTKNAATKLFRAQVKRVKANTPIGKTGNLQKAVGLKTSFRRNLLTWRIIFRNKKAPYANAVNFAKWHPQQRFFTDYYEQNKAAIERQAAEAIIKAVLQ